MEEPADAVVLRLSHEQVQLLLEAVQDYSFDLVYHQSPPVKGIRGRSASEAQRRSYGKLSEWPTQQPPPAPLSLSLCQVAPAPSLASL